MLKIEKFAKKGNIPIIGKIPYSMDFVNSTVKMKPVVEINKITLSGFNWFILSDKSTPML